MNREALMVILAREIGLSVQEIASLGWSEVHLEAGLIVLTHAQGRRRFALTEEAVRLLRGSKDLAAGSAHVFPSARKETHLSTRAVQQVLRAAHKAGVRSPAG